MAKLFFASLLILLFTPASRAQTPCSSDTIPPELVTVGFASAGIIPYQLVARVTPQLLLRSYTDNCTPAADLELGIRLLGDGTGFPAGQTELLLGCFYQNRVVMTEVWARDAAGNTTMTTEPVGISDLGGGPGGCGFFADPSLGSVCAKTPSGAFVERYSVSVQYQWHQAPPQVFWDHTVDRCTHFLLAGTGFVYLEKDHNHLNGVSTLDLVRMVQHIQGSVLLDSPYKIIAADINRSGSVTMLDVVELQRLLLGLYDRFPENTSWRFLPEDHVFPDPTNPLVGLPTDTLFRDFGATVGYTYFGQFIGVKVGDVNETANPLAAAPIPDAPDVRMGLHIEDVWLPAGAEVIVPLNLAAEAALLGLQGALQFDPERVSVQTVVSDALPGFSADHFHIGPDGLLRIVWYAPTPVVTMPDAALMTLKIKALAPVRLSDAVRLNEQVLPTEVVFQDYTTAALRLHFSQTAIWAFE